jgi:hypothetical protein
MSQDGAVVRLVGMAHHQSAPRRWLTAIVAAHLVVCAVHGAAHDGAHVPLSMAASLFVYIVILAGPPVGLAMMWAARRPGAWIVAVTMIGALVFGVLNHFVIAGPDHVSRIALPYQSAFAATAVLLALIEAAGAWVAVRAAVQFEAP